VCRSSEAKKPIEWQADFFAAAVLDCLTGAAKRFYQQWDFAALPSHPYRLFVSYRQLEAMMQDS